MFDVVIPAYNAADTILDSVTSAKDAGASVVIVVNDGSTDQTAEIARLAGAVVITQSNSGAARARHLGAERSKANYIVFLDSDDAVLSDGVHKSLQILNNNDNLVAVGGGVRGVMPSGRVRTVPRAYRNLITSYDLLTHGFGAWPPGAAVIRRQAFLDSLIVPIPRLSTKYAEDYEMFVRVSIVGNIFAHETPSILYRMFDGKSSNNDIKPLQDKEAIRAHYAHYLGVRYTRLSKKQLMSSSFFRRARTQWARGQYVEAGRAAVEGLYADPVSTIQKLLGRITRLRHR